MTVAQLPPWPTAPVAYGPVVLRRFSPLDVPMVQEMSADPYIPGLLRSHQEIGGQRRDMLLYAAIRQNAT
jgi:hypothetical protein